MKNIISWKILPFFAVAIMFFASCEKDDPIKLDPKIATWEIKDITSTSAVVSGLVIAEGSGFNEHGICWALTKDPTVDDNSAQADKVEKAVYTASITGLEFLTTYHVRAYTKSTDGTVYYGGDTTFTTLANLAFLSLDSVYNITATNASGDVNITNDGKSSITVRGLCWNTETEPTIENTKTEDGTGTGTFTGSIAGLIGGTTYYVRAYATNGIGTAYSNEISFTTPAGLAVVTSDSVKNVTKTDATVYGNVLFTGGADVTEKGICWSTSADPTIADNTVTDGTGTGLITGNITGLTAGTTYYARVYATNSEGTAYGDNIEFTTVSNIVTWNVPGDYVAASYPGSTYNDWDPANSPQVINTAANPDILEGYVYMANTTNQWKFASQNDWSGPNYGEGANPGELDPNGGNISLSAGYYKLNVDLSTNPYTYTAVATTWGIIGSFTGWSSQVNMTYDPASMTFQLAYTLAAGDELKFRANDDWGYNYGSNNNDGNLDAGGANIPISIDGDYAVTMDLSTPNAYTYSVNTWGVIGDATPGDWTDDTNMTWDAGNGVFTVTLDLTVGEFKFRANDDWAVNLGGDINALTQDGANIAISTAGNYTITLNPWTKVATVTQN